jgi:hypothetical protein
MADEPPFKCPACPHAVQVHGPDGCTRCDCSGRRDEPPFISGHLWHGSGPAAVVEHACRLPAGHLDNPLNDTVHVCACNAYIDARGQEGEVASGY